MTVCVAAICDGNTIIGASDRMVTGPEMLFQPDQTKTRTLTSSIIVMWSGDSALQAEIIDRLKEDVIAQIAAFPDQWVAVHWAARQYQAHWSDVRRERAERALLWPLGLNQFSFLDRQATMSPLGERHCERVDSVRASGSERDNRGSG